MDFDLCVIGAGPAGFAAASRAWDLGLRVALVESGPLGGAGVHRGALSSKTLWELAKDYATARRTDRGYRAEGLALSYAEVCAAVAGAVAERVAALTDTLAALAEPSPTGGRVTRVAGRARLVGEREVEVAPVDGGDPVRLRAAHVLLATGSAPRRLPGLEVDGRRVVTSDHLEDLPDFPRRLVVLGAGVVGCEYATIFARFGRTDVHLVDKEPRILPFEDADVSAVVTASLRDLGLTIHHRSRLVETALVEGGVRCVLEGADGDRTAIDADTLLLSIGRAPATTGLGLEALGVARSPSGALRVEGGRTSLPWLWAAGDTTADVALVNVAELEGRHAVETLAGLAPPPIAYDALSSILFVSPEVASVGLDEQQARARGVPYRAAIVENRAIARNVAMRATRGFVKLLASPDGRVLGLRVVGPQASSTIQGAAFLVAAGRTLADIDATLHPHPSVPEGVQEAARLLLGRPVLKPSGPGGALHVREG